MRTTRRSLLAMIVVAVLSAGLHLGVAAPATAITWAPAATASIHPGVQMITAGAQCTANYVYSDGTYVYLGYAAHCAGLGGQTDTNGCLTRSRPLGTRVQIDGATQPGILVYSSWATMRAVREPNPILCERNDFALVRLNRVDNRRVNPSVPHWGGPAGINTTGAPAGSTVHAYGNSIFRLGLPIGPVVGVSEGTYDNGWAHPVYSITPAIPGDSGMAGLDSSGRALGVFTTIGLVPYAAESTYIDLHRALKYMRAKTNLDLVRLVLGTEPFRPLQAPLDI